MVLSEQTCKYLGVALNEEFKWRGHVEPVYRKLIRLVDVFYKLRNKLPYNKLFIMRSFIPVSYAVLNMLILTFRI
jgi:hypothetical protein